MEGALFCLSSLSDGACFRPFATLGHLDLALQAEKEMLRIQLQEEFVPVPGTASHKWHNFEQLGTTILRQPAVAELFDLVAASGSCW